MTQFSIHWILSLNRLCQKWGQVHRRIPERTSRSVRVYLADLALDAE